MNTEKYLNIPNDTCDCFELVRWVYRDHGIDIGSYCDDLFFTRWKKVDLPALKELDVLHMKLPGTALTHVGIYVGDGMFLHSAFNLKSMLSHIHAYKSRILGAYRWHTFA